MLRGVLLVGLVGCPFFGCYSQDNPADPNRCAPPCQAGEICWEGTCRPADGGPTTDSGSDAMVYPDGVTDGSTQDQSADATPSGSSIVYKKCTASGATQTSSTSMGTIYCSDGDFSVTVTANGTDKYLFILNVPDNWLECKLGDYSYHRAANFQINDGSDVLSASGYTAPHGQRMPMTLVAAKVLSAGQHTIDARWAMYEACPNAGGLKHGKSPSWLIVVRADPQDLQDTYGPASAESLAASQDWTNMPIPSFTVPPPGGDYLLILTTPPTYGTKGAAVQYRIRRVHNGTDVAIGYANLLHTVGAGGQSFPVTIVEGTNLQAGDVIRAQWKNWSSATVQMVQVGGTVNVGWLVGLRTPKGIQYVNRSPHTATSTTSTSPVALPDLPLLQVTSKGGNHLLAFTSTGSTTCAYAPYYFAGFDLHVDGAKEASGYFSSHGNSNLQPCQRVPVTLFAVKNLSSGSHNIGVYWFTSGSPYDKGKTTLEVAQLLALSR